MASITAGWSVLQRLGVTGRCRGWAGHGRRHGVRDQFARGGSVRGFGVWRVPAKPRGGGRLIVIVPGAVAGIADPVRKLRGRVGGGDPADVRGDAVSGHESVFPLASKPETGLLLTQARNPLKYV